MLCLAAHGYIWPKIKVFISLRWRFSEPTENIVIFLSHHFKIALFLKAATWEKCEISYWTTRQKPRNTPKQKFTNFINVKLVFLVTIGIFVFLVYEIPHPQLWEMHPKMWFVECIKLRNIIVTQLWNKLSSVNFTVLKNLWEFLKTILFSDFLQPSHDTFHCPDRDAFARILQNTVTCWNEMYANK